MFLYLRGGLERAVASLYGNFSAKACLHTRKAGIEIL